MKEITKNTPFQTTSDTISIQLLTGDSALQYSSMGALSYAWTDYDDTLLQNQTYVIANIPVGLWLRVPDSDIVITEK